MANQPRHVGILWEGPSPLDGAPLVAICTASRNVKTGDMAQVYILRADISPVEAVRSGLDTSICGNCAMRGDGLKGRACYVQLHPGGPAAVWRCYKRGGYQPLHVPEHGAPYFHGVKVRWGAYGDPAMIPEAIVRAVNSYAAGHTGYTHQWRHGFAKWTAGVFMASADTYRGELTARAAGWGTFRVGRPDGSDAHDSVVCRNERDGTECKDCLECDGRGVAIFIPAHGTGKSFVPASKLLRKQVTT
jgi:hypothetical protein